MDATALPSKRRVDDLADHLARVLGGPVDDALLLQALTHRSYAYEHGGLPHNERLEFLGDSVLGLAVTEILYTAHPELPEGQLAKLRSAVVNRTALAEVARALGLGRHLLLGRGEEATGGRDKDSILADTTEAVLGAVYLSGGLTAGTALVHHLLDPMIDASADLGAGLDWKTSLQELCAQRGLGTLEYLVSESGPDHRKTFVADAVVDGAPLGRGSGHTKKAAELKAAAAAWTALSAGASARTSDACLDARLAGVADVDA